ncbi:hypothetical protein GJU43_16145 [Flavobacterium sp. LC2016-23]|nr:hypothetical protein [Flavobacterium sp. LC2016-23]
MYKPSTSLPMTSGLYH